MLPVRPPDPGGLPRARRHAGRRHSLYFWSAGVRRSVDDTPGAASRDDMTALGAASQRSVRARLAAIGVLAVGVAVALSVGRLHTPPAI
jgi:hypothetical protein